MTSATTDPTTPQPLTDREREKFRKLLEVANSTTYEGEKEAALAAATRLAKSRGMSLHEAAGMSESIETRGEERKARRAAKNRKPSSEFDDSFTAPSNTYRSESEQLSAEKKRHKKAKEDAVRRGLQVDDKVKKTKKKPPSTKRASSGSWRSRSEFIRVLLRETRMSVSEVASTAGVPINEVFKEKLLMRQR